MAFGGKDFDGLLLERMEVAAQLWNAGIRAEFAAKVKPRSDQQFKTAKNIPLAIILGQDEVASGQVKLKNFVAGDHETNAKDRGQLISRADMVEEVKKLLKMNALK
jgi:histidyl-tRNA synthetase